MTTFNSTWCRADTPDLFIAPADAQALRRMVQLYRLDSVLRQLSQAAGVEAEGYSPRWAKKVGMVRKELASLADAVDWCEEISR